tara:strand:+ start:1874 stop:2230 length:357 start_codon:yes stop_codon:yes gene_type:complete
MIGGVRIVGGIALLVGLASTVSSCNNGISLSDQGANKDRVYALASGEDNVLGFDEAVAMARALGYDGLIRDEGSISLTVNNPYSQGCNCSNTLYLLVETPDGTLAEAVPQELVVGYLA